MQQNMDTNILRVMLSEKFNSRDVTCSNHGECQDQVLTVLKLYFKTLKF